MTERLNQCISCGKEIPDHPAYVCPACMDRLPAQACVVCGGEIPIDSACVFVNQKKGLCVCGSCVPRLREKVRVAKLSLPSSPWLGFQLAEDGGDNLLAEVRELLSKMVVGDELTIRIEEIPLQEVLCWEEHRGW